MGDSTKSVAFIPVRLSSSRLPEKHFKRIGNVALLSWVIRRLKDSATIDEIVICAPDEPLSDKLKDFALAEGVELFIYQGGIDDVVGRLVTAAKLFEASICVLASGDCPLIAPKTLDTMVRMLKEDPSLGNVQFAQVNGTFAIHEGLIVSRRWLWELADKYSDTPQLREHQFPVYLRNVYPEKFKDLKTFFFKDDDIYYSVHHRISVDTPDDLKFMNCVFDSLKGSGKDFNLEEVISLLADSPEMCTLNKQVYQKDYNEKSFKALICVTSGSAFLNTCLSATCVKRKQDAVAVYVETGKALLNLYGIGVRFASPDDETKAYVESCGFSVFSLKSMEDFSSIRSHYAFDVVVLDEALEEALEEASRNITRVMAHLKDAYNVKTFSLNKALEEAQNEDVAVVAKRIAELLK